MQPLKGVRILDLTTINPFTDTEFSDYGAEVIKVERPGSGDTIRDYAPFIDGISAYHCYTDRGKKSITLNLKADAGKEILKRLVKDADILVENFKNGTMEKMGLGFEELSQINPALVYGKLSSYGSAGSQKDYIAYDIAVQAQSGIMDATGYKTVKELNPAAIYASITGFGESGPLKDHLADDLILTAMSGMMDRTGRRGEPPMMPGVDFGGTYSGVALLSGIAMALFHRLNTGEGVKLEVSVLDCIFYMLELFVMNYSIDGKIAHKNGNQDTEVAPLGTFAAQDGYAAIAISSEGQWKKFCALVGAEQLAEDPRFADNAARLAHLDELIPEIGKITGAWKKDELVAAMGGNKLAGGALKSVSEIIDDAQIRAAEMIVDGEDPTMGALYRVGTPMKLGATPMDVTARPAPTLGQHTEEILQSLGM